MHTTTCLPEPKFCIEHSVIFDGGEGIIHSANWQSGQWTYLVEMALGEEPEFGRIGPETTVLLSETDLYAAI